VVDINLLHGEKQKQLGRFLAWVLTYGRYIIIGTEIIVLLAFLSRFKLDRQLTDLHQSISQKQAIVLAEYNSELQIRALQNHLLIIKKLQAQRDFSLEFLNTIEKLTPSEVVLTDVAQNINHISLVATADTNDGFTAFLNNISASPMFSDISIDEVSKGQGDKKDKIEFKISAVINNI